MSLRFGYVPLRTATPVWSLDGRGERPRPIIAVALIGPSGMAPCDGLVDTGADDTVFPERLAQRVGLDLTTAPLGTSVGVGGAVVSVRYAQVTLRLTDGQELREWPAKVGFAPLSSNRALLGFAGFLQFFEAIFRGDLEEVELTVNRRYPGT